MDGNSNLSNCDFSLLPPHVIAQIFKYLDFDRLLICARTCKSWYYASCDPIIWKNIAVRIDDYTIRNQFDQFHRPMGVLRLKNFKFDKFYNYKEFFAKFGQDIREIDFCKITLTLQQLFDCLIFLNNLISLTLRVCGPIFTSEINLSNSDKEIIKTNLNSIRDCFIPSDVPFKGPLHYIMSCMPNLKSLRFGAFGLNKPVPDYYTFFEYVNMFEQEVNLDYLSLALPMTDVSEFIYSFSKITQKLNISKVDIYDPNKICTDLRFEYCKEMFAIFYKKLSNVHSLTICTPLKSQLEDEGDILYRYMTNVTELNIDTLIDENIRPAGYLQDLERLTLYCSGFFSRSDVLCRKILLEVFPRIGNLMHAMFFGQSSKEKFEVCLNCKRLIRLELFALVKSNFEFIFKQQTNLDYIKLNFWFWRFEDVGLDYKQPTITEFGPCTTCDIIKDLIERFPNFKLRIN